MHGGLTAILLLSCAQQWPGKLLHFLTMIWFCDPLSIVPYQPLEGACWLSSNFQSWNLGGLCRTLRVLRPPDLLLSQHTITWRSQSVTGPLCCTGSPSSAGGTVVELRGNWNSSSQTSSAAGPRAGRCSSCIIAAPSPSLTCQALGLFLKP